VQMLLADDHDLFRESVSAMVSAEGSVVVVEVSDLSAALSALEQRVFDLILLDYQMPGMNGLEGLSRAITAAKGKPVAVISGTTRRDLAEEALARGAAGFVPKTLGVKAMIAAVQLMAGGGKFAPLSMLDDTVVAGSVLEDLTRREMDVLRGLCEGKSNKEIARDLDVQEVTIKLHVKTLTRKLGAKNRTHAAMIARDSGLASA
jgi:two-component system, NarL family, nitrate/nitrite response regulator NarL